MCNKCPENSEIRPNWLAIFIITVELAYHVNLPPLTAFLFINNAQFLLWQCPTHHISRTEGQCGVIRYQNHTLFGAVGKRRLLFICIGHFHRSCQNKKRYKIKYKRKVPPSSTAATTARPVWTDTIYHQLTKRKCGLPVWLISLGQRGTYAA